MHRFVLIALCWGLSSLVTSSQAGDPVDLPPSHTVKPELYATGFEFAEGPALDDAGNLFVVNYRKQTP